jgi:hypothetical protein
MMTAISGMPAFIALLVSYQALGACSSQGRLSSLEPFPLVRVNVECLVVEARLETPLSRY